MLMYTRAVSTFGSFFKRMLNEEFDVTPEEETVELRELTKT